MQPDQGDLRCVVLFQEFDYITDLGCPLRIIAFNCVAVNDVRYVV